MIQVHIFDDRVEITNPGGATSRCRGKFREQKPFPQYCAFPSIPADAASRTYGVRYTENTARNANRRITRT